MLYVIFVILSIAFSIVGLFSAVMSFSALFDWADMDDNFRRPWHRIIPFVFLGASGFIAKNSFPFDHYKKTSELIVAPISIVRIGPHQLRGFYLEEKFMPICNNSEIQRKFQENRRDKNLPEISEYDIKDCNVDSVFIYKVDQRNGFNVTLDYYYEVFDRKSDAHDLVLLMNETSFEPTKEKTK